MTKKQEILNAFHYRFACKEFDVSKKMTDEDFEFILETARLSPSSFGFEPWKLLIVENTALRQAFMPHAWGAQTQLPTADKFVIVLSRTKNGLLPESDYIQNHLKNVAQMPADVVQGYTNHFRNFLENDFDLLANDRLVFEWASRQAYLAMANMMTSAAAIGIDSCPIEGFDKQAIEQLLIAESLLDTDTFGVSAMLAFGYRKDEPSRQKIRQSLEAHVQTIY
ncbi:NAD(P)H-dependent oxidoreductase [Listeria grandensis]|uniref:NAD(P)H-dependent oxidoreductase n=1 Tax=Listeria grandensis TaxID=1494963 RepID=A0A7X0Y5D4_9LIST|nr:NAD(P)H-dependent oxidoreductase [Listeria grandensis]MBC1475378.1 NAD(P)H-dependent oxidoreductase [Listeria grandensis]MBC1936752.1 NAD(P)H-dependent oxidoreductase [Listeria grandensis]